MRDSVARVHGPLRRRSPGRPSPCERKTWRATSASRAHRGDELIPPGTAQFGRESRTRSPRRPPIDGSVSVHDGESASHRARTGPKPAQPSDLTAARLMASQTSGQCEHASFSGSIVHSGPSRFARRPRATKARGQAMHSPVTITRPLASSRVGSYGYRQSRAPRLTPHAGRSPRETTLARTRDTWSASNGRRRARDLAATTSTRKA
jgi:hypothetical protein